MQEAVRGVAGLAIREDSVEDLVLTEAQDDGEQLKVDGVCLGKARTSQTLTLSINLLGPWNINTLCP